MGMISKTLHIGVDLALVSAFLAGVRRNTGLGPNVDSFDNDTAKYYTVKYLDFGEKVFDYSVAFFGTSDYFKRNN